MANEKHEAIMLSVLHKQGLSFNNDEYVELHVSYITEMLQLLQSEHDKEVQQYKDYIDNMTKLGIIHLKDLSEANATIRQLRGEIDGLKESLQTHLNNNH